MVMDLRERRSILSTDDPQDEQVTFRQESIENVFSQGAKPFFVQSPPKLSQYTFTFVCFLLFGFASLYFIKLPVHISAIGEVIAGKDYHQIVVNEDDQIVTEVLVIEGEKVRRGQALLQLDSRDEKARQSQLQDIDLQIDALQSQVLELENYYQQSGQNIAQAREAQMLLVKQLKNELQSETDVLLRYQKNVANGLTSALLVDEQKRNVSQIQGSLIRETAAFTSLDLRQLEIDDNYKRQKEGDLNKIARLKLDKQRLNNGLQIFSPCDCIIDNVFIDLGLPVVAGQSILTLSRTRESSSLMLYVQANQYRAIEKGSQIQVNLASYPSNKYGALKASVMSVSASPVPGAMIRQKGQGLQDTTYFVIKALIDKVPNDINLVTGMSVDSDIVIDDMSLFDLLFDVNNKR